MRKLLLVLTLILLPIIIIVLGILLYWNFYGLPFAVGIIVPDTAPIAIYIAQNILYTLTGLAFLELVAILLFVYTWQALKHR